MPKFLSKLVLRSFARRLPSRGAAALCLVVLGCTHPEVPATEPVTPSAAPFVPVHIVMTVDWEGRDLVPESLADMQALRRDYPALPILHFLNAAYFTKPQADAADLRAKINSVLLPIDQRGLHIHAWKTLFEAAGVKFRPGPSLANGNVPLTKAECASDCGHAVPISAYTEAELAKVISFSLRTLQAQGFGRATQFRAGAWMLAPQVASALVAQGIDTDTSALPAQFLLGSKWGDKPLYFQAKALWSQITPTSQPYQIATAHGPLYEVPDNGCLADYMTGEAMLNVVKANRDLALATHTTHYVVVGFHQETAHKYLGHVRDFLKAIDTLNQAGVVADFQPMPKAP